MFLPLNALPGAAVVVVVAEAAAGVAKAIVRIVAPGPSYAQGMPVACPWVIPPASVSALPVDPVPVMRALLTENRAVSV